MKNETTDHNEGAIQALLQLILQAERTVFFGGAGVSTASGVPDFRSQNGLYARHLGAESILTPSFMRKNPQEFYRFYRAYFMMKGLRPNACHLGLAALEKKGLLSSVITQNVDSLHHDAGSRRILELHGSGSRFYCSRCQKPYSIHEVEEMPLVPHCQSCGGLVRPDIVLYEESLDNGVLQEAVEEIEAADLLIIGGTSLSVYPAAALLRFQKRGQTVLINREATAADGRCRLILRESIDQVFARIMEKLDSLES